MSFADKIDREKRYDAETFRLAAQKELERLYSIRDLMESKGYKSKRRKFERKYRRLLNKVESFTAHVGEFERSETEKIMSDDSLTPEQKQLAIRTEVYPQVQAMFEKAESTKEYAEAVKAAAAFLDDNRLMYESTLYELKRTSPLSMPFVDAKSFFGGEEGEEIEIEMPSDCIYDAIKEHEEYLRGGYLADYERAVKDDSKQARVSAMQLDWLFENCDTVCFHAEKDVRLAIDDSDERFAKLAEEVYKSELTENWGMQVLRIYLKPSIALKEYLKSFVVFDKYHHDLYERFYPYVDFADVRFLKDGEPLLDCLTHEGYFETYGEAKEAFHRIEKDVL